MAKEVLAIYDPCRVYLERFVSYASEQQDVSCKAQGYTDLCILAQKLQERKIDAVLLAVDDNCIQMFQENESLIAGLNWLDGKVLFMGRQYGNSDSEWKTVLKEAGYEKEIRYICRYQSAQEILRQVRVMILQSRQEGESLESDQPFSLAGLYSPADKRSHPRTAAAILKDCKKPLYINLEQFSGLSSCVKGDVSTISDILYCYRTTPGKLAEVLFRTVGHGFGMDILTAPDDLADLEELGEKDWPVFLRAVAGAGDYQTIFLDMSVFDWKLIDVILSYGILYIPALPYDPGQTYRSVLTHREGYQQEQRDMEYAKMKEFRNYFVERGMEEELARIREVKLEDGQEH